MDCKFRRQQTVGPYIADFLCIEPKLIIELDGGQHLKQQQRDAERTLYLQALGYRVLRFWNHEVLNNLEGVLESIRIAIMAASSPNTPLKAAEKTQFQKS